MSVKFVLVVWLTYLYYYKRHQLSLLLPPKLHFSSYHLWRKPTYCQGKRKPWLFMIFAGRIEKGNEPQLGAKVLSVELKKCRTTWGPRNHSGKSSGLSLTCLICNLKLWRKKWIMEMWISGFKMISNMSKRFRCSHEVGFFRQFGKALFHKTEKESYVSHLSHMAWRGDGFSENDQLS